MFKYVRKINENRSQSKPTSTAIFPDLEPHALRSGDAHSYDVVRVLHQAFATLAGFPELTLTGSQ
jgi:hypothetical protein